MQVQIEIEQEEDGRFLAEAPALPGALHYAQGGRTPEGWRWCCGSSPTGWSMASRRPNCRASLPWPHEPVAIDPRPAGGVEA
mgnify:CR=1 FL=1